MCRRFSCTYLCVPWCTRSLSRRMHVIKNTKMNESGYSRWEVSIRRRRESRNRWRDAYGLWWWHMWMYSLLVMTSSLPPGRICRPLRRKSLGVQQRRRERCRLLADKVCSTSSKYRSWPRCRESKPLNFKLHFLSFSGHRVKTMVFSYAPLEANQRLTLGV